MADCYARFSYDRDERGGFFTINLGGDLMRFRVTDGNAAVVCAQMNNRVSPETRNNPPANVVYLDSEPEERAGHHDRTKV